MLEGGRGRLVESTLPGALGDSLIELIRDHELRRRLGQRAYEFSRTMIWPEVGARYRGIFERVGTAEARPRSGREVLIAGHVRA
jgi:glycosyltransferase involved in cell wall biosynthesis